MWPMGLFFFFLVCSFHTLLLGVGAFSQKWCYEWKWQWLKTHVSAGNFVKRTGCSKHSIHVIIFILGTYEVCFHDEGSVTDKIPWVPAINRLSSIAKLISQRFGTVKLTCILFSTKKKTIKVPSRMKKKSISCFKFVSPNLLCFCIIIDIKIV